MEKICRYRKKENEIVKRKEVPIAGFFCVPALMPESVHHSIKRQM